jgi:hypothetical protein
MSDACEKSKALKSQSHAVLGNIAKFNSRFRKECSPVDHYRTATLNLTPAIPD